MSDIDDVTAAADNIEQKLPHGDIDVTPPKETYMPHHQPASKLLTGSVADRLDHATREQLIRLAQYASVGEPTP